MQQPSDGWNRVASSFEKCMDKLADTNSKLFVTGQLPKIKVPVFDGDPLKYPIWNSAFIALVDSQPMGPDMKLNLMNQYVTGEPKQVVEHYLLIGTEDAYTQAKSLLQKRYGNCNVVSTAFLKKLESWPKMGPKDSVKLREFSDLLDKILAARRSIPSLAVLDYAKENVKLVSKIPRYLENKWRDMIKKCRLIDGEVSYPSFQNFADFIREAADKANIPELDELYTSVSTTFTSKSRVNKSPRGSTLATTVNSTTSGSTDLSPKPQSCLFCDKSHSLSECESLQNKPFKYRKSFFFKERLCLGCAASKTHQIADCNNKSKCRKCSKSHPTCLHEEKVKSSSDSVSNCMNVCSISDQGGGVDHTMIVPVWVRPQGEPDKETLQYAVLDDHSNVTFISDNLCVKLGLQGSPTEILLTTMQQQNARIQSRKVIGIEVLDYHREHVVNLPNAFTREVVSANRSQIPKPEVAREWEHLKCIADKITPYHPEAEISLLIGNNCPRVIRPREVVPGGEDEPYGQRTLLGWGVIGTVCKSVNKVRKVETNGVCNRVVASETSTRFALPTKAKEIINSDKVIKILETDFVENSTRNKSYSVEDEKVMRILESSIHRSPNGHYEMPLPLKSDSVCFPYNRQLAEKKWNQLKARFKKNPKFLEDYKAFMSELIEHCAEKVPADRLAIRNGKVNYVPHTGVYHPKKPSQIRVVFDCSAKFEDTCLNDHLLQGPDLMNGLLGVLCRFRQERVAFMTDIKEMFHQFLVSEEYRDLLRFLWWENGDPSKPTIEYRMNVHLFGAASSPGCANFGLKRAADDGEKAFGSQAANFIRNDFYVDDGLKSVSTANKAINLIKSSQAICSRAGLRLHKIVSNNKKVLEAIPEEDRTTGLREINLEVDPLPMERALGVIWNVEDDNFQFRIELRDRPFTRRGVLSTVSSIYDPNGYIGPVTLKGKQILQQMCKDKVDWDSPVPENLQPLWQRWRGEVLELHKLKIPRCFKPENFGVMKDAEIHYFSDASTGGYGQCSYIRLVNEDNKAHCSFVVGKTRVTPLKQMSIPRLELTAATVSAKMSAFLRSHLEYPEIKEYFWTDSQVVLGYINNEAKLCVPSVRGKQSSTD